MVESEIVQAASNFDDQVIKPLPHIAEDIMNNAKDFDPSEGMFNRNALMRNSRIPAFFFWRQFASFGFLGGLKGFGMVWFIALKASIFPEFAAFREVHLLLIGQYLVMAFAFNGGTEALNLARRFVGDDIILYRVALLLARVIRLLARL